MLNLYDVTLRDGNHALRHSLDPNFVSNYCQLADRSGVYAIEVGHGNGLGASSYLVGKASTSDRELLKVAREKLTKTKLAIHAIPGFATINRDLKMAIDLGVDVFRIATHATEATTSEKHIEFLANNQKEVHGVLMMSHMNTILGLVEQAKLMKKYGASAIILMDSSGHFLPSDVKDRVEAIKNELNIAVGFHAHNNLGVAITNAFQALNSGAEIIDGASMGLGAGSGNAQLENLVAVAKRNNINVSDIEVFFKMSEITEREFFDKLPRITSSSIQSGLAGVFSGYAPQVKEIAQQYGVDESIIWEEMAKRKLVAGQETMIKEIAVDLMNL
jgi:4-hydroxy 2-oxovalerate aldolase